jgi:hypothetical protein
MARTRDLTSLSRAANSGLEECAEINETCHGWRGVVDRNQRHVIVSPRVYAVYWDEYFDQNGEAVYLMNEFFRKILRGMYMLQLRQYGVGEGALAGHIVIPDPPRRPPRPLPPGEIEAQLKTWIQERGRWIYERNQRAEAPASDWDENHPLRNPLFIVFTLRGTNIGDCLCGYHQSGRFRETPGDNDLFWAAIQEWHHDFAPNREPSPREIVDSCTWCVSHEMVEAFTNPDGQGYHTNDPDHPDGGCEIGDICECAKGSATMKTPIIKTQVDGWWVEPYWDNQNQSCYPLHVVPRADVPQGGYER